MKETLKELYRKNRKTLNAQTDRESQPYGADS